VSQTKIAHSAMWVLDPGSVAPQTRFGTREGRSLCHYSAVGLGVPEPQMRMRDIWRMILSLFSNGS